MDGTVVSLGPPSASVVVVFVTSSGGVWLQHGVWQRLAADGYHVLQSVAATKSAKTIKTLQAELSSRAAPPRCVALVGDGAVAAKALAKWAAASYRVARLVLMLGDSEPEENRRATVKPVVMGAISAPVLLVGGHEVRRAAWRGGVASGGRVEAVEPDEAGREIVAFLAECRRLQSISLPPELALAASAAAEEGGEGGGASPPGSPPKEARSVWAAVRRQFGCEGEDERGCGAGGAAEERLLSAVCFAAADDVDPLDQGGHEVLTEEMERIIFAELQRAAYREALVRALNAGREAAVLGAASLHNTSVLLIEAIRAADAAEDFRSALSLLHMASTFSAAEGGQLIQQTAALQQLGVFQRERFWVGAFFVRVSSEAQDANHNVYSLEWSQLEASVKAEAESAEANISLATAHGLLLHMADLGLAQERSAAFIQRLVDLMVIGPAAATQWFGATVGGAEFALDDEAEESDEV